MYFANIQALQVSFIDLFCLWEGLTRPIHISLKNRCLSKTHFIHNICKFKVWNAKIDFKLAIVCVCFLGMCDVYKILKKLFGF